MKSLASYFLLFAIFIIFPLNVHAQTSTLSATSLKQAQQNSIITVATVNIYNATTTQVGNNTVVVNFDLSNRLLVQSGVKYGLMIMKGDKFIADEFFVDKEITLSENEIAHQTIQHTYPSYFNGIYKLYVVAKNVKGLTLGIVYGGDVVFKGAGNELGFISQTEPCYVTRKGSSSQYYSLQGVAVNPLEELLVHCPILNTKKMEVEGESFIEYYKNDFFSNKVSEHKGESVTIIKGEQDVSIPFTAPKEPHPYDALINIKDAQGEKIFTARVHFVVSGISATIQNVVFDKIAYAKGDIASLGIFWAPSVDVVKDKTFYEASNTETKTQSINTTQLRVSLLNKNGKLCGEDNVQNVNLGNPVFTVHIPISAYCEQPKVRVVIENKLYGILDDALFTVIGHPSVEKVDKNIIKPHPSVQSVGYVVVALIICVIVFFLIRRKILLRRSIVRAASGVVIILSTFSLHVHKAHADNFMIYLPQGGNNALNQYIINFNKATYSPGEAITITSWGIWNYTNSCTSLPGDNCESVTMWVSNAGDTVFNTSTNILVADNIRGATGSVTTSATAASTPGTHTINLTMSNRTLSNAQSFYSSFPWAAIVTMGYTVVAPPTVHLYFSKAIEYLKNILV